ncbi:ACT domain-containing protein, partial [Gordonibacter pamelaeae]
SSTTSHRDGMAEMRFLFQVSDVGHIDVVLDKLRAIEGVFDARRMLPGESGKKKK